MASRSLDDLTPHMKELAIKFQHECHIRGADVLIYCTLRSNEEQGALYAQGRSKPGKIVTNARPGDSAHNPDRKFGKASAFDCCPLNHGKPVWDAKDPLWSVLGKAGEEVGLIWSGRWTGKLRETAHFQDANWRRGD